MAHGHFFFLAANNAKAMMKKARHGPSALLTIPASFKIPLIGSSGEGFMGSILTHAAVAVLDIVRDTALLRDTSPLATEAEVPPGGILPLVENHRPMTRSDPFC
jgi:hypothetical protein